MQLVETQFFNCFRFDKSCIIVDRFNPSNKHYLFLRNGLSPVGQTDKMSRILSIIQLHNKILQKLSLNLDFTSAGHHIATMVPDCDCDANTAVPQSYRSGGGKGYVGIVQSLQFAISLFLDVLSDGLYIYNFVK